MAVQFRAKDCGVSCSPYVGCLSKCIWWLWRKCVGAQAGAREAWKVMLLLLGEGISGVKWGGRGTHEADGLFFNLLLQPGRGEGGASCVDTERTGQGKRSADVRVGLCRTTRRT